MLDIPAADSHSPLDVAVIGHEAVDEFADRVRKQQGGAYSAELGSRQCAAVYQRLFHYAQTDAADIIQAVAYNCRNQCL